MNALKKTPVLLLTGYLGSGKTTLVNHILTNERGIRFAVIVNDIGEVNIDADLIQKGGIVGKKDDSLVALQNGCICCTLKMDLVAQLGDLIKTGRFDYIVIEASGICEPEPIARTICSIPSMGERFTKDGVSQLDCIVTVVDALRMQAEFGCGESLTKEAIGEDDIENLLIQQIEFCNIVLLNKVSEVKPNELARIKGIIQHLQPGVEIIETDYAVVSLDRIINTHLFNYDRVATSAGWIRHLEQNEEASEDHDHEHDHEHNEEEGEAEEYGISTFTYCRRPPFDINKFDHFIAKKWPHTVIRAKGILYFQDEYDMCYMFEQSGSQKKLSQIGQWYATAPEEDLEALLQQEPGLQNDWDEVYGDRMIKLVFIGQHLDKAQLAQDLDDCIS